MVAVDTAPSFLCVSLYPKCDSVIKRIFEFCHQIWKIADEKRKEREKDEQSLYKTKVVDITDENGEEEDIETVLKETFPNYEKDFEEDITDKEEWIEPKTDRHDNNHHSDDHHGDDLCEQFDENEVNRIKQLHNDWSSDHVTVTERSNAFINMYSVGVEILNKMGGVYKPGLTDIGGHIWASNDVIATNTMSHLHRWVWSMLLLTLIVSIIVVINITGHSIFIKILIYMKFDVLNLLYKNWSNVFKKY